MVRVRFAPSPTGIPHVGNIRTALFDFCFAKSQGGVFILRIEDTDQARLVEGAVEKIKESLTWLGASWDEFITQSERLEEYKKFAGELIANGKARNEEGAVRFIVPKEGITSWIDAVGNKEISFQNKDIEDFIILKKDGFPTYHLANVIDDHLMHITHVIRGEDWIPSAPKHIMLYEAFGWKPPVFAHVPNVLGTDGKKLSKRKGARSVLDYKEDGYLAAALFNYLMLLGWSPKDDREILSRTEIEKEFTLENVNVAPATFDERKLLWMNGEYIRAMSDDDLKKVLLEFDPEISSIQKFEQYLSLAKTRMKTLKDFKTLVADSADSADIVLTPLQKDLAKRLKIIYESLEDWTKDSITGPSLQATKDLNASTKDLYTTVSGVAQGLPFAERLEIKGKADTLEWLEQKIK